MKLSVNTNIDSTVSYLRRVAKGIEADSENALSEAAKNSWRIALTLAPFYSGEVIKNISVFRKNDNHWSIISKTPASDEGFPVNYFFDEGILKAFSWYPSTQPRSPQSVGFMVKTAQFAEEDLSNRLNIKVERTVNGQ